MIAWKARSQLASLILAGSAILTADPSARGPAGIDGQAGVGKYRRHVPCRLIVTTRRS
jgi:hypothetical protein